MNEAKVREQALAQIKALGSGSPGGKEKMMWVKFSDEDTIPVFREQRNREWISFGADNKYPEKLLRLFQESSDHRAIILGKARYIYGNGLEVAEAAKDQALGKLAQLMAQANAQESFSDIAVKAGLDWEIFRGFGIRIKWNSLQEPARFYHIPFQHIRTNETASKFWICKRWGDKKAEDQAQQLDGLEYSDRVKDAVFYFTAYDPASEIYPLPEYIAAIRHIEIDTHIAKFHRSNVMSGWSAGSMVVLKRGEPDDDEKRKLKNQILGAATGAEKGGEVLVYFADEGEEAPEVVPMRSNDLDKQYLPLVDSIQQKILTAHNITNGMLFGVKTPGQLGGRNEILESWDLLEKNYIEPNQQALLEGFRQMFRLCGLESPELIFRKSSPISRDILQLYDKGLVEKAAAQEALGVEVSEPPAESQSEGLQKALSSLSPLLSTKVLEKLTDEEVRSLAGLPALPPVQPPAEPGATAVLAQGEVKLWAGSVPGSPDIRIRPVPGKTRAEAEAYLESIGFGFVQLGDEPIQTLELTDEEVSKWNDAQDLALFAEFGEPEDLFEIIPEADSQKFEEQLSEKEIKTLSVFKDNPLASLTDLSRALWIDVQEASEIVTRLIERKLAKPQTAAGGGMTITPTGTAELDRRGGGSLLITTRWKYSGPQDDKNRPFCAQLMALGRVYEREDIEELSRRLGYDVWRRRGGWYHVPNSLLNIPHCRHEWKQIVVRRRTQA